MPFGPNVDSSPSRPLRMAPTNADSPFRRLFFDHVVCEDLSWIFLFGSAGYLHALEP